MATLTEFNSTDDFSVFVAFHVMDETSVGKSIKTLSDLMYEVFGNTQTRELISEDQGTQEVIYRIQKPVLVSKPAMDSFFRKLMQVFNAASGMTPHFTQISEEAIRGTP